MQHKNRVRSHGLLAAAGGHALQDEELAAVLGGVGNVVRITSPNSPTGNAPSPATGTPSDTFTSSLLGSLLGYSSNSFVNTLVEGNQNNGATSPFGFLGF